MVDRAVVTDFGSLADDDAHAVVDEQATADGRARMNLDAGHVAGKLRQRACQKEKLVFVQPMRLTVIDQRMETLIQQKDLERGARGGVAIANRARIVEQAFENHTHHPINLL